MKRLLFFLFPVVCLATTNVVVKQPSLVVYPSSIKDTYCGASRTNNVAQGYKTEGAKIVFVLPSANLWLVRAYFYKN